MSETEKFHGKAESGWRAVPQCFEESREERKCRHEWQPSCTRRCRVLQLLESSRAEMPPSDFGRRLHLLFRAQRLLIGQRGLREHERPRTGPVAAARGPRVSPKPAGIGSGVPSPELYRGSGRDRGAATDSAVPAAAVFD